MLQQTQVSRVIDRFEPFVAEFPTAASLALADESRVLALWSGLGYYRRARLLHRAAKEIAGRHGGIVPRDRGALEELPGVGKYTAGAIASIAFGLPEALVDGNVARVLFRIHGREATHADPGDMRWAWERAESMVGAAAAAGVRPGELNEGLMELGATVCTPASPRCEVCPAQVMCRARAMGRQDEIPRAKKAVVRREVFCGSVIVEDGKGRLLVEQRPGTGMWAGMWQAPTVEVGRDEHGEAECVAGMLGGAAASLKLIERFEHQTTHRRVHFAVWRGRLHAAQRKSAAAGRVWATREEIAALGISSVQRRILLELSRR